MGIGRTVRALFLVTGATLLFVGVAAIQFLERLVPVAEHAGTEVAALETVEETLALLAAGPPDPYAETSLVNAAQRLGSTAATDAERAAATVLARRGPEALRGDPVARAAAIRAARELAEARRTSARLATADARRLARAGAWTTVFVALGGFVASLILTRRVRRRVVEPILELDAVLTAVAEGDTDRRCRPLDAPPEVRGLVRRVNDLLDRAGSRG